MLAHGPAGTRVNWPAGADVGRAGASDSGATFRTSRSGNEPGFPI
jgi:hypothetical protein